MYISLFKTPADFVRDQPWIDIELDPTEFRYVASWFDVGLFDSWVPARYVALGGVLEDSEEIVVRVFEHDFESLLQAAEANKTPSELPEQIRQIIDVANYKKWAYFFYAN